jgi:hypothetical protein
VTEGYMSYENVTELVRTPETHAETRAALKGAAPTILLGTSRRALYRSAEDGGIALEALSVPRPDEKGGVDRRAWRRAFLISVAASALIVGFGFLAKWYFTTYISTLLPARPEAAANFGWVCSLAIVIPLIFLALKPVGRLVLERSDQQRDSTRVRAGNRPRGETVLTAPTVASASRPSPIPQSRDLAAHVEAAGRHVNVALGPPMSEEQAQRHADIAMVLGALLYSLGDYRAIFLEAVFGGQHSVFADATELGHRLEAQDPRKAHLARLEELAEEESDRIMRGVMEVVANALPRSHLAERRTHHMSEPIATIARATAHHLTDRYGPHFPTDVEAALHQTGGRPQQYLDPVSLGGLIVSVATLAWQIYQDLNKTTAEPKHQVITRTIRLQLPTTATTDIAPADRNRIIDAVVTETLHTAQTGRHPTTDTEQQAKAAETPNGDEKASGPKS